MPKVPHRHRFPIAAALFLLAIPSPGNAQLRPVEEAEATREEVAAAEPTPDRSPDAGPVEAPNPATDRTDLGVDFEALRLIAHQDQTIPAPAPGPQRITIDPALPAPDNLEAVLTPYLDQPVSLAALGELSRDIVQAWRGADYPLVDVYFPEQNITSGVVQIVVREAVLGEIRPENLGFTDPDFVRRQLRLEPGDRINRKRVESDLDWLNEHPMRLINLIYERGEADGTSDLVLRAEEQKPWWIYAGLANTGIPLTGENEWSAGFQWWNPLGIEHGIGYNFASDVDFESLQAHTAFYQILLPWRHRFHLTGAYAETRVDSLSDTGLPPVAIRGHSLQLSGDYIIPFKRVRSLGNLRQAVGLGIDYKRTDSDLFFDRVSLFENDVAVLQFRAHYEADWVDPLGSTRLRLETTYSPGNLVDGNDNEAFRESRDRADADYIYLTGEIDRSLRLPSDFTLRVRTHGQWSPSRLTATEQMLAGGYLSVRGFDEYLARGDSGLILNVELATPAVPAFKRIAPTIDDRLQLFAFYDAAWLAATDADAEFEPDIQLQSAGLGLRYRIARNANARLAYGWNIRDRGIAGDAGSGRLHFGVSLSY